MHPILFRIPMPGWELPLVGHVDAIPIYSYGVMLGLSLVVGWYLTLGLAERDGLPRETMANNYVITALAAVAASRLLYILTNLDEFNTLGDLLSFRRGGLVAYGGFIGGFVGSYAYLQRKRIPLLPWADVAVPSLASGLMITRIGCYLFGCDYGERLAEDSPSWLKTLGSFPHWPTGTLGEGSGAPAWVDHIKNQGLDPAATHSFPVHPTQLYESLVGMLLLGLLLLARRRQRFRGQIFFVFTFAYGFARFMLELLRADPERGSVPPAMSQQVLIPLCLALFAVGYALTFSRMIRTAAIRMTTQVVAFVPAVVAYLAYRPGMFEGAKSVELSTSQFIGLTTGLAVCAAFFVFDKAAQAHPEVAMALDLPREEADDEDDDDDDEDDEDEDEVDDAHDEPPRKGARARRSRPAPSLPAGRKPRKSAPRAGTDTTDPDGEPDP